MEILETKTKWASPEIEAYYNDLCQKIAEVFAPAAWLGGSQEVQNERIDRAFKATEAMRSEAAMLLVRYSSPAVLAKATNEGKKIDMTRQEALSQADDVLLALIRSGDPEIMAAVRGPDGLVDQAKLVATSMRVREKIADKIQAGEI